MTASRQDLLYGLASRRAESSVRRYTRDFTTTLKLTEGTVVSPSEDPVPGLAHRLKDLRLDGLAGRKITQRALAEALGASVPLISSWESTTRPKIPPKTRIEAYAAFFATDRSVTDHGFRILPTSELDPKERAKRDRLFRDLVNLRDTALGSVGGLAQSGHIPLGGLWQFPPGQDVTIVCTELPDELKALMPYANPEIPDYVRGYGYTDLDALIELYGHLRAANPSSYVNIRPPRELATGDYTAHLALLGGVDWNPVTADLIKRLDSPVRQIERKDDGDTGAFTIVGESQQFAPEVLEKGGVRTLESDIAYFYRGRNPFNRERTVTICNGMYGRGTLGAVRALTHDRLRARNEAYVRDRFVHPLGFSILTRVMIVNGEVVPPDWTSPDRRLHEWQEEPRDGSSDRAGPDDHGDAASPRLAPPAASAAQGGFK